tara:strand:+ start:4792 stop:5364 length:573 start_codon:yes stop_codon:yes gene_type:complete
MTSLSQIEEQIKETQQKLAELENKKRNLKILETFDLDENEMQRTSNLNVETYVSEYSSEQDEYGYSNSYKLKLTYDYTTVLFKTPTEVETKLVSVKFEAICNEEQTYECRYDPRKDYVVTIIAKRVLHENCPVDTPVETLYEYDIEDVADEGEDGLDYNKTNGAYLHIVDYILTKVDSNDEWGEFIKELN